MYVLALPCLASRCFTMLHEEKMTWQGTSIYTLLSNLDSSQPYGYDPVDLIPLCVCGRSTNDEVWSLDVQHEICVCGSWLFVERIGIANLLYKSLDGRERQRQTDRETETPFYPMEKQTELSLTTRQRVLMGIATVTSGVKGDYLPIPYMSFFFPTRKCDR